jgi:hypothetical protein
MPLLLEVRAKQDTQVYCRRDGHYSGEACELIASHLANLFKDASWLSSATPVEFKAVSKALSIKGDLAQLAEVKSIQAPETVKLRVISGAGLKDENSPVLLFGDSHNLVFDTGGEMHASSAGLPSQLAFELGIGMDVMGVFGSGATSSRMNIMRRASREPDFLKKKVFHLVHFCPRVHRRQRVECQGPREAVACMFTSKDEPRIEPIGLCFPELPDSSSSVGYWAFGGSRFFVSSCLSGSSARGYPPLLPSAQAPIADRACRSSPCPSVRRIGRRCGGSVEEPLSHRHG